MAGWGGPGLPPRTEERAPPCAFSGNPRVWAGRAGFRWSVTTAGDAARLPAGGPGDGDAGGRELAGDTDGTEGMVTAEAVAAPPGTRGVRTGAVGPVDAVGVTLVRARPDRVPARPAIA